MNRTVLAFAAFAILTATPALAKPDTCLRLNDIYNWKAADDRTLIVENYRHQKFKLSLMGVCTDIRYHEKLAFRARGGFAISCLTPGDEVIVGSVIGPQHCAITRIELYTAEMQHADDLAKQRKNHPPGN